MATMTITIILKPNSTLIIPEFMSRDEKHIWLKSQPDEPMSLVRFFAADNNLDVVDENRITRTIQLKGTYENIIDAFGLTLNTSEDTAISHNPFLSYEGPIVLPDYLLDKVISVIGLDQRPPTTGVHREK